MHAVPERLAPCRLSRPPTSHAGGGCTAAPAAMLRQACRRCSVAPQVPKRRRSAAASRRKNTEGLPSVVRTARRASRVRAPGALRLHGGGMHGRARAGGVGAQWWCAVRNGGALRLRGRRWRWIYPPRNEPGRNAVVRVLRSGTRPVGMPRRCKVGRCRGVARIAARWRGRWWRRC